MNFRVIDPWKASYADPIRLQAGDPVHLTGRKESWDGHIWLWAMSSDGLEGWIPDTMVREEKAGSFATSDYTANELTCAVGQIIIGEHETHGWIYCRSEDGTAGWVPRRNLTPIRA